MNVYTTNDISPRMHLFICWIFPIILVIVGLFFAYSGFRVVLRAQASTDWPTTDGIVRSASIESHRVPGQRITETTYDSKIVYKYMVDDVVYTSSRVVYGKGREKTPSEAEGDVDRYSEGKTIVIYYLPNNPDVSVLEPGIISDIWYAPGFGLFFILLGVSIRFFMYKLLGPLKKK